MEIILARYQRDELHEELVNDAGAVGELTNHIRRGELTLARRLRARFEEDMRLLDQIGWEEKGRMELYKINLDPNEIQSIFQRLLDQALHIITEPPAKSTEVLKLATSMAATARVVLEELNGEAL
jgi:hypothetical protein